MFSRVKIVKNALVAWLESSPDHAYTGLRGEGKRKKGGKEGRIGWKEIRENGGKVGLKGQKKKGRVGVVTV